MKICRYLELNVENYIFRLEKINESVFRVRRAFNRNCFINKSLMILPNIKSKSFEYERNDSFVWIKTGLLNITIDLKSSKVVFKNKHNNLMLQEDSVSLKESKALKYSVRQNFKIDSNEGLYGLGQYQDGVMNYQNSKIVLSQSNRTIAVPFLTSTKGYGILWDNNSLTEFEAQNGVESFYSEVADCIDYYFVYGENIDGAIKGYRYLTGQAPMYGKWAYGFWQCKERYQSFDELENIVKEYRKRKIPIDNIIQDWKYWGELGWSALDFDSKTYPDPKKRISELHDKYKCKLMVSIWPSLGAESEVGKEMNSKDMFYPVKCWNDGFVYDVYNPEAQKIYWKYVKKNLFNCGVDAYWIDGSEPEFFAAHTLNEFKEQMYKAGDCFLGSLKEYFNSYALKAVEPVYNGQRECSDQQRVYILTRSGFAGLQRYGASSWSGDIAGSWDVLLKQIAAGINFCMSGIPYWTHDIGGFFTNRYKKGCEDLEYRELYLRWFQFGVFSPIFRSHGTNTPREIWRFGYEGEVIYDTLVKFTKLRYRLLPYIYSCAGMITQDGYTLMRGLPMDFSDDKNCFNINDQYMFGPAIMVCPVTERMYHKSNFEDGDVVESEYFTDKYNSRNGLHAEYYGKTNFEEFKLDKVDSCIDFDWSGGTPEGVSYNEYSIIWEGFIHSDVDGVHELTLITCSARVTIDEKCLLDTLDYKESDLKSYKFNFDFEENRKYPIKIKYSRAPDSASICLKWKKPGQKPEEEPAVSKERGVYLPGKNRWYDFWTSKMYSPGQNLKVDTPLEKIPLFVKEGSIIPHGPEIQYTSEKTADPIELYIYSGANGKFTIYEDEGDNYNYEKDKFSEIDILWKDKKKNLMIGDIRGGFNGMLQQRKFIPIIVEDGKKIVKVPVEYYGKKISIEY